LLDLVSEEKKGDTACNICQLSGLGRVY